MSIVFEVVVPIVMLLLVPQQRKRERPGGADSDDGAFGEGGCRIDGAHGQEEKRDRLLVRRRRSHG